jgi:hypothetical protein
MGEGNLALIIVGSALFACLTVRHVWRRRVLARLRRKRAAVYRMATPDQLDDDGTADVLPPGIKCAMHARTMAEASKYASRSRSPRDRDRLEIEIASRSRSPRDRGQCRLSARSARSARSAHGRRALDRYADAVPERYVKAERPGMADLVGPAACESGYAAAARGQGAHGVRGHRSGGRSGSKERPPRARAAPPSARGRPRHNSSTHARAQVGDGRPPGIQNQRL